MNIYYNGCFIDIKLPTSQSLLYTLPSVPAVLNTNSAVVRKADVRAHRGYCFRYLGGASPVLKIDSPVGFRLETILHK